MEQSGLDIGKVQSNRAKLAALWLPVCSQHSPPNMDMTLCELHTGTCVHAQMCAYTDVPMSMCVLYVHVCACVRCGVYVWDVCLCEVWCVCMVCVSV